MSTLTQRRQKIFRTLQRSAGARGADTLVNENHDDRFDSKKVGQYRRQLRAQAPLFKRHLDAFLKKHSVR